MKKKILFLFGTRPEAIKLAPVIIEFQKHIEFEVRIAVTAQHREILDSVLHFFNIVPHYDLNIMTHEQNLAQLSADLIKKISEDILTKEHFDYAIVQGDTTSAMAGAIAAFYQKIKVIHIEAGLRSGDIKAPFPEEQNRVYISKISDFHFCATPKAAQNLLAESIKKNVYVVGNTVIDALSIGKEKLEEINQAVFFKHFENIDFNKKVILFTCHRRESFGEGFKNICAAINEIAKKYLQVEIVFPVHLNPNIKEKAHLYLQQKNIHLIAPLDYPYLIWLLSKSYLVLSDSGGIQEEAPYFGKPILVLRNVTERQEGIDAGVAKLVGINTSVIVSETARLIDDISYYSSMAKKVNPYGDGSSAKQIATILKSSF